METVRKLVLYWMNGRLCSQSGGGVSSAALVVMVQREGEVNRDLG